MSVECAGEMAEMYGQEVVYLIGGSLLRHGRAASAKAVRGDAPGTRRGGRPDQASGKTTPVRRMKQPKGRSSVVATTAKARFARA